MLLLLTLASSRLLAESGTAIAADQTISGATGATKFVDLTLASAANTDVQTARVLYVNVSANAAVTCDVALYGDIVSL
jgi:hypothetical protein